MRGQLLLSWRCLCFHRMRSVVLLCVVALTLLLPLALHLLTASLETELTARAARTPLIVGARDSQLDLVLHALYFRDELRGQLSLADVGWLADTGLARPVPMFVRQRTRGYPLVGTTLAYFDHYGLRLAAGRQLAVIGDCLLGAAVAEALGLQPGDKLATDPVNVFDLAGPQTLMLNVAGVLGPAGSVDDRAVFVDLKTTWVVAGLGHGHEQPVSDEVVLRRTDDLVTANAALPQAATVTPENLASFHFHGDASDLPVTAILCRPPDTKSATLLRGRLQDRPDCQIVQPAQVLTELMQIVFRVKGAIVWALALVATVSAMLLGLLLALVLRLREREFITLHRLGCPRGTVASMLIGEFGAIAAAGIAVALVGGLAVWQLGPGLIRTVMM